MIDWNRGGRTTSFRYVRVAWPTMSEIGVISEVIECTVEENTLTALKVTGTLDYASFFDIGDDLIRVYSDSTFGTDKETICHATLFVSTPASNVAGVSTSGTADMYSTLLVLQEDIPDSTLTADAGANAVEVAKKIAQDHNLSVIDTPSSYTLSTSRSFDETFTYLDVINDLLASAGYASATVDTYGNIIMAPYVDPMSQTPSVTFSDTEDDVSDEAFKRERDTYHVPNVVKLVCSNADNTPLVASAINDDPHNPYSTVSRKKSITRKETVNDIDSQEALNSKARELLLKSLTVVDKVEIGHAWKPYVIGDAVMLDYQKANTSIKLATVSRTIKMTPDLDCVTTARKFVKLMGMDT